MDDPVFLPFQERGSGNDELSPDIILKVFWAPNPLGAPINAVFVANATIMSEITIVAFSLTGGDINNPWNTNAVFPEYASEEDDIAFGSSVPLTTNATGESSITLSALPNPSFAGNPVSLTAFVESEGTPIGFVTFVDGTEVIATGVVESEAGVTVIINDFSQGFHNLIANFAGSSVSAPSTSPLVVLEVENGL
jgi:hypothetical protein